MQDPKMAKNLHLCTIALICRAISSQLRHISTIGKELVKQQYLLHMSSQCGELRPISGWDLLASLGHPCKFQRVSRIGSVTTRHSSSGRQPNFAALNRERHLYSAGRPWRWTLAHISSKILCAYCLCPWLGPPLTTMQYVMYFRFCGWRHFFTPWTVCGPRRWQYRRRRPAVASNLKRIRRGAPRCLTVVDTTAAEGAPGDEVWCLRLPCFSHRSRIRILRLFFTSKI